MVAPKKNPVVKEVVKRVYKVVRPSALQRMKQGPKPPPKPKDNHYTNNPVQPPKKKYVKVSTQKENEEWAVNKRMKVRAQQAKRKPRVPEQGK
jgi:hypothetical protein